MKHGKENRKSKKIIFIILIIVCIACITYIAIHLYNSNKNKNLYNELYEDIENNTQTDETKKENSPFVEKVQQLQQENTDVKGWIRIDDTNINYPILQTTDNNYYLTHNYKKEETVYGSIFMNCNSNIENKNANVIIYGHDMQDGQMFKDLLKYKDKSFYDQHSIINISTADGDREYEIVYVFKSRVFYKDEKNVFRFYQYYDFENERKYNEYIENCKKIQLYDTGKTAVYGDQLITLITCEYSQKNGRMVVVAKKIK